MSDQKYDYWVPSYETDNTITWKKTMQRKSVPQSYFDSYSRRAYFAVDGRKFCFSIERDSKMMEVKVFSKHNVFLNMGLAFLHPGDEFDSMVGAKVALTDALSGLNLTREERSQIWQRFFETVGKSIQNKQ